MSRRSIVSDKTLSANLSKLSAYAADDKATIESMKQRIDQQRLELSEKGEALAALTRNFEDLSTVCKGLLYHEY